MSMAVIGIAGVAVSAGTAAYSAYSQNKAASDAKKSAADIAGAYKPLNLEDVQNAAIAADRNAYSLSDKDFQKRHPLTVQAEKLFEQNALKDQTGNTTLTPQLQNEFMRAGLGGTLGAFGDSGAVLAPGSAGEAGVARNLGIDINAFQQQQRQNRNQSLMLQEQLAPRRSFGMTGQNVVSLMQAGNQSQNNVDTQAATTAANQQAAMKAAQIQQTGQMVGSLGGLAQTYMMTHAGTPSYATGPYGSQYEGMGQLNGNQVPIYKAGLA